MDKRSFSPLPLIGVALLAACKAGPDYAPPAAAGAEGQWLEPVDTSNVADIAWWRTFGDEQLVVLVDRALEASPGMAEAEAKLAEARAMREVAQGGRWPQGGASASATRNRISENGQIPVASIPGFDPSFPLYDAGFDASWELDFWGKTARGVEGARAREEAALWGLRDVRMVLVAELARAYVDLRGTQADLALAEAELDATRTLAQLSAMLRKAGEASAIDAEQAAAALEAREAAKSTAQADLSAAAYRIAALVGEPPEALVPELIASNGPVPAPPAVIAAGVRADMLARRPDVRRAERELAAATAGIGVAKADLYPSFSLIGSVGQQARQSGDMTDGASNYFSFGPILRWPLFNLGTLQAKVRAADARAQGAAARYQGAITGALADSESAANRFVASTGVAQAATRAQAAQARAFDLAQMRFDRGEDDRLALAQARLDLAQVQRREVAAAVNRAGAAIAFYKALGGGWQDGPDLADADGEAAPLAPMRE